MISTWQAPLDDEKYSEELLVSFDQGRARRVLILPALFDEANKMRRFTLQVMRALDALGIDSFLPDLPGQNESLQPLENQTLKSWRIAARAAAEALDANEYLSIRAGALIAPEGLDGQQYAPQTGPKQLRAMLRARTIAAREAGHEELTETLSELGRAEGLVLAGWPIGAAMFAELEAANDGTTQRVIEQKALGGRGLWLRAEPDEDAEQAHRLATLIAGSEDPEV
ncbi:hypothetical protein [uncultured Erythrobacter sp.]|uniref:hypothetical protein n=1 Tax=uncultured Erythrobacter sp. TaxID=263913 RepID=UPI002635AA2A|nr:hypothetical protein [uncultured Erythrobacter sp.]